MISTDAKPLPGIFTVTDMQKAASVQLYRCRFVYAEDKGFEPSHRLTGLTHFECAPFDHLGNPPSLSATANHIIREEDGLRKGHFGFARPKT